MSADLLRKAASLMRERAEAAQDWEEGIDRWEAIPAIDPDNHGWLVCHAPHSADYDTRVAEVVHDYEGSQSRHIASWHPAVALAVADWLDVTVRLLEPEAECPDFDCEICSVIRRALAVARLFLGDPS